MLVVALFIWSTTGSNKRGVEGARNKGLYLLTAEILSLDPASGTWIDTNIKAYRYRAAFTLIQGTVKAEMI